jgi:tripartite-type tricarboxylate transporter receptor subunit TctC
LSPRIRRRIKRNSRGKCRDERTVTIITPFAAGSQTDAAACLVGYNAMINEAGIEPE